LFFKFEHPVLEVGKSGSWDSLGISEPVVIRDGNVYKMWYEGLGNKDNHWRIGYATSSDGIHWTKHGIVLDIDTYLAWCSEDVLEPWVMKDGQYYKMWYTGNFKDSTRTEIGYAFSEDGIVWKKHPSPVLSLKQLQSTFINGEKVSGASEPCVIKNGKQYVMYFQAEFTGMRGSHISYAVSNDGIEWNIPQRNNPVIFPGGDDEWDRGGVAGPALVRYNRIWLMFYNGFGPGKSHIGMAVSINGINFDKFPGNPVIVSSSNPEKWDYASVYEPAVILNGNVIHIWFGGFRTWTGKYDENTKLQIGYAVGRIPLLLNQISPLGTIAIDGKGSSN
jgi:predicted GH43/DUF377 family glycosyl hydrolase